MIKKRYVLTQILCLISRYDFKKILNKTTSFSEAKGFTHWEHFICLSYGQLTQKESIRSIVLGLKSRQHKLYHIGIRSKISLSTLSYANRNRSWLIYKELAYVLIDKAIKSEMYRKKNEFFTKEDHEKYETFNQELKSSIYALDSSTIDLCLSVFSWANPDSYRDRKKKVV